MKKNGNVWSLQPERPYTHENVWLLLYVYNNDSDDHHMIDTVAWVRCVEQRYFSDFCHGFNALHPINFL